MSLRQVDEFAQSRKPHTAKRVLKELRRIPLWLRIVGGGLLTVLVCSMLIYGLVILFSIAPWVLVGIPHPCVDGGPGTSAVFSNGGTTLFIFPESAAHIESSCYTWQSADIDVWFEMDADDLEPLLDSMDWDVRPLAPIDKPPTFGNRRWNATYLYGEYSKYPEGASIWIDTRRTPYRVFVNVWLD